MEKSALAIQNLSFRYDSQSNNIIDNISLEVPESKIIAILGPNGAGKTTLLHLLLGYNKPINGDIFIHNKSLQSYSRRELSQLIGIVPQWEPSLFNFSVIEYVLLGRAAYLAPLQMPTDQDVWIAQSALSKLDIVHLKDRPISDLSGGERQIVLFARILAQSTDILLLDEPTSHLDLSNQGAIIRALEELSDIGRTVVIYHT